MKLFAGYLDGATDFLGFAGIATVFVVLLGLVLLSLREVFCWYWKVNQVVANLESIDRSLRHHSRRLRTIEKSLDSQVERTTEEEPEPLLWPPMLSTSSRKFDD